MADEVIARKKAQSLGLRFYFTGMPCHHGHIAQRKVLDRGCVACRSAIDKRSYYRHQGKRIDKSKRWNKANIEYRKKYQEDHRPQYRLAVSKWARSNREKANIYRRAKWASDLNFRLRMIISSRINQAIWYNTGVKSAKTLELLGCSVAHLRNYLEAKFRAGMTWDNAGYGKGKWHIDHIVPCAVFDLTQPDEQKKCFHFSNLQPLWSEDNFSKGSRGV